MKDDNVAKIIFSNSKPLLQFKRHWLGSCQSRNDGKIHIAFQICLGILTLDDMYNETQTRQYQFAVSSMQRKIHKNIK